MIWLAWAVFAASAGLVLFVYAVYPLVLLAASRLRPRPVRRAPVRPSLSVVIPVFNEAAVIGAKVADTLAQDYPRDRLEVVIVSDGSTDGTGDIVLAAADPRVRLLERPREGKIAALNAGVVAAAGEIVALTDANTLLAPGALAALVEPFADPEVGGVCGRKRYRSLAEEDATGEGERAYWGFDSWLKELESRAGSVFAADGALYAVRRELYVPPIDPAQADDIAISARVVLQGHRLVTAPRAVAFEPAPTEGRHEFARKVRVTNHSVRALLNLGRGLWTSGFYSFELLGHKLLRHFVPLFLVVFALASVALAPFSGLAAWAAALQLAFYALGLAGLFLRRTRLGRLEVLALPYFFCLANGAALVGVLSVARGRRLAAWTPRGGQTAGPTAPAHPQPAAPDPGDRMHKPLVALLAAVSLAASLAAQEEPASPVPAPEEEPAPDRIEWEAGLGAAYYDNFFQAADDGLQTEVHAGVLRFGGEGRLSADRPLSLRGAIEHLEYDEDLENSTRAGLALRHRGDVHRWSAEAVTDQDVPNVDVGDDVDRVDALRFLGDYSYWVAETLDVGVTGQSADQDHDLFPERDNTLTKAGGFLRFRRSGVAFSPEVGYLTGERDVDDENLSYDEDELYVLLRVTPSDAWYVSLRYRDRDRQYTIADPLASNFARQDDRIDWTLSLAARFARRWGWNLYGTFLDADSTKPTRVFETTTVSSWVSVGF